MPTPTPMRSPKHPRLDPPKDDVLTLAIKSEIKKLLRKPLTPETLGAMGGIIDSARTVLAAKNPLYVKANKRRRFGVAMNSMYDEDMAEQPMAYSPMSETFGAKLVRELVAIAPTLLQKKSTPEDTVRAIATAKEEGMHDLAESLTKSLKPTNGVPVKSLNGKRKKESKK